MNKQGGSKFKKLFYKSKSPESQPDSGGKLLKKRPSRPGDAEPKSPNGAKKKTFGSWRKKKNPNEPSSPAGPDFTDETEDLDSRNISFDAISIRTENNLTLPKSPSDWEMDSHTTTPSATKSRKNRSPTDEKNRVFERLGTFFNSGRRRKSKGSSEVSEATTEEPAPFAEYTASPRQDEREGIKRTDDLPGSRAYEVTASGDQLENKNKSAHTVEIVSVKQAIKHLDVTTHSSKLQSFEKVIDFSQHSTKSVSQGSSLRSSKSLVINVGSSTKLQTGGEQRVKRNVKHFKTLPSRKGSASDSDLEKTEVPAKELQVYLEEISVSSDTKGLPGKSVGKKFTRKSDIVSKVGSRYQEITQTKEFGFQEPSSTKTSKDNKDLPPPELTRESLLAPKEVSTAYHAVSRRSLSNAETPLAGNEPESQRLRDCSEVKSQKETKALTVEVFLQPDGDCSPGLSAGECPVAEAEVMRRKSRHSGGERSLKSPDSQQPVDEKPVCSTDNTFCEVTETKISAVMGNNVEDSQQALEARSTVLLNQEGRVETNLIKSPEMIKQQLPSLELPRKNTMAQHSPLPVFALPASMNTRSKECASTGITVQAGLQSNMPAVSTTKNTQVGNANEAVHREDSWVAVSVMNAEIKPSEGEATTLSLESTRTPSKALHGEKALSKKASLQFEVTQGKAEYNRKGVKEVITKATTTSVKSEIKIPPILKKVNVEVKSTESKLSEKPGKLKDRISVFENKTTSFKEKEFFVTKNIAHSPKFSKKFTGRTNLKINRPSESKIMEGEKKIDGLNKSDEVGVWRNNQGDLQTAAEQPDHTENTVQSNTFNQNQISTEKTSVDSTSLGTSTNIKTTTETSKSSSETPQLENNNCDIPKQKIELNEKAKTEVIETKAPIVIKEELPSTVKPEAIVFLISNRSAPGTSSKRQTSEVVTVTSGALSSVDEGKTKAPAKEENMSAGDSLAMQQTTVITQIQEQVTQVKNKAATENTFNVQESTEQPLPDAKQQRFTGIDTCRLQLGRNTAQNSPSSAHATANQQLHLNNVPKEQDPSAISQQNKIIQEKTDTKNKLLVSVLDLNTVKQQSNDLVDAKIEFSASEKHITTQQKTSGTVVKTVSKLPTSGQKSPIKEQSDISLQTGSKLPRPVQKSTCKQLSINDTEQHPESNLSKVEKDPHTSLQQNTTNPQPDNIVLKTVSELSTSEQKSPIKDKSGNVLQTGSKLPRPVEKGTSKQLSNYDSVNATSESVKLVQQDSTEQQSNSNILQTVKKLSAITQSDDVIKAESELAMPGEKSTSVKKSESSIVQMVKEFSTPVQQSAESTVVKTAGELPTTGEKSFTKKQSEVSIVQAEEYLPKSELKRSENLAETASELTISGQKSYVAQHEKELNISVQQAAIKVQSETTTKTLSKSSIVQEEKVSKLVQDSTTKVQSDTSVVKVTEEFTTKGQESPAKKQSESNTVQAGKDLPKSVLNNTTKVQSENVVEATSELTTSGQKSSVKIQSETSIAQKELTRTGLEGSAKKQSERNIVQLGKDLPMSVQNVDEATSELTIPGQKSKKPSECGVQQMEEELSTSGQQTKIIKVQSDGEVVKTIGELSGTGQESSKKPSESIVQAQKDLPRSEQNVVEATNKLTSSVQERTVQKQSEAIITQTESKLPIPEHEICTTQQQSKSNVSHKGPILVQQNAVKEQSESSVVKTVSEPPTTVKESKVKKQSDCNTVHIGSGLPALVEQCTEEKKDLSLNAAASVEYPNKSKSNKTENESAENASLEQVQDSSHKQENKLPTSNITGGPLQNVQMESLSQPTSVTAIQSNTTNSPISEKEATTSLTDITKSEFKNKKPLQYSDLNKGPEVSQNAAAKQCIVGAKSRLSSEIVLKSPAQFNKRDTPSNWLDVEQSCGQKEQNLKNKLNTSESDDSVLDTSGDLESFVENIRNLGNPFSLPQKRLKPLKSPAPPFAMPPIKEDRFEKTLDPDVFKFGLGKKEKSRDTPSSTLFKLQSMEAKSKLIPKRSSAEQSILFKSHQSRSINSVETQNPGNSGNESVDGVVRRSRLEKSSIVSSLLSPSTTPRMNLSATTSTALSTVLSPSETETALSQETKSTTSLFLPSTSSQLGLLTGTSQTSLLLNGVDGSIKEHAKPSFLTNDLLGPVSVEFPTPQFLDIKLPSIVDKYLKPDDTKTAPVPENSFQMPEFKLPEFPQSGLESSSDYNVSRFANGSQNFSGLYNPSLLGTQALIPGMPSQNMEIPVLDQRRTHKRPGKLVIYDQPQFSGEANEIFRDVEDATSFKLSPVISVRVVRGCWIFYEKPHFQGRSIALEEGQTELVNVWNEVACEENAAGDSKPDTPAHMVIGSIKLAVKDYRVPEIDLFTDPKGMGRKMTFFDDSLETCTYGILINTSSIKVHSGVWLVFEEPGFCGCSCILEPGEYPYPESWGFQHPIVGSLRPLKMGGLKVEHPNEPKAIVYEKPFFEGKHLEIESDAFNFNEGDDNEDHATCWVKKLGSVGSIKILRGIWMGYEKPGFEGHQYLMEEGQFENWKDWGGYCEQLQSLRPIIADFLAPHMKLYSEKDFGKKGHTMDLLGLVPNMEDTGFGEITQSAEVISGVWVAFEDPGFSGQHYILEKGMYSSFEDWGAQTFKLSSVQPIFLENIYGLKVKFKVQLFSEPGFQGSSQTLEESASVLPEGISVKSCKVLTGSWVIYEEEMFGGKQYLVEEGNYPDLTAIGCPSLNTCIKSVQIIDFEFSEPYIMLFAKENFRGKKIVLKDTAASLQLLGFNAHIFSVQVGGGIWVVYEQSNYRGEQMLLAPSEISSWHRYSGWHKIGSLRPVYQKRVFFRLRNRATGTLMSVTGSLEDIKLSRIQAVEDTGAEDHIWFFQEGLLRCRAVEDCCLETTGTIVIAGNRLGLSPEPGKENHFWSISPDGLIRFRLKPECVLEVKGGEQYDKNQVILNTFDENKQNQRWDMEIL